MVLAYQELERRRIELQNLGSQISTAEAQFQERYGRQVEGESFIGSPEQRSIALERQRKAQLAQQQLKIVQRMGGNLSRFVPLTKLSTREAVKATEQYQKATAQEYEGYTKEGGVLKSLGEDYSKKVDMFNQEIQDRTDFMNNLLQRGESVQTVSLYQYISGDVLRTGGTTDVSRGYSEGEISLGGEDRPELLASIKRGAIEKSKSYLGVGAEDIVTLDGRTIQESILSPEERVVINEAFGKRQAAMAEYERAREEEQDRLKSGWSFAQQDTAKLQALFDRSAGMTPTQSAEFLKANLKGSLGKETLEGVRWEVGGATFSKPEMAEKYAEQTAIPMYKVGDTVFSKLDIAEQYSKQLMKEGKVPQREDELPLFIDTPLGRGINPEVFKREREYWRQEGLKAIERGDFYKFTSGTGAVKTGLLTNENEAIKNIFGQSEGWSVKLFGGKENVVPERGKFYKLDIFGNVITERQIKDVPINNFVDETTYKIRELSTQVAFLTSGIAFAGGIVPVTGRGAGLFAESLLFKPKPVTTTVRGTETLYDIVRGGTIESRKAPGLINLEAGEFEAAVDRLSIKLRTTELPESAIPAKERIRFEATRERPLALPVEFELSTTSKSQYGEALLAISRERYPQASQQMLQTTLEGKTAPIETKINAYILEIEQRLSQSPFAGQRVLKSSSLELSADRLVNAEVLRFKTRFESKSAFQPGYKSVSEPEITLIDTTKPRTSGGTKITTFKTKGAKPSIPLGQMERELEIAQAATQKTVQILQPKEFTKAVDKLGSKVKAEQILTKRTIETIKTVQTQGAQKAGFEAVGAATMTGLFRKPVSNKELTRLINELEYDYNSRSYPAESKSPANINIQFERDYRQAMISIDRQLKTFVNITPQAIVGTKISTGIRSDIKVATRQDIFLNQVTNLESALRSTTRQVQESLQRTQQVQRTEQIVRQEQRTRTRTTPEERPRLKVPPPPGLTFGSFKDSVNRASKRGKGKYVWNIKNPVPTFRSLFGE